MRGTEWEQKVASVRQQGWGQARHAWVGPGRCRFLRGSTFPASCLLGPVVAVNLVVVPEVSCRPSLWATTLSEGSLSSSCSTSQLTTWRALKVRGMNQYSARIRHKESAHGDVCA